MKQNRALRRTTAGFSLLELLVIAGIMGIAATFAFTTLRADRGAVRQAARGLAAQVTRARLEAMRQNEFAGVYIDSVRQRYVVYVSSDDTSYDDTDQFVSVARFSASPAEYPGVRIASGSEDIVFDPRGMARRGATVDVLLTDPSGSIQHTVRVNAQGRAVLL